MRQCRGERHDESRGNQEIFYANREFLYHQPSRANKRPAAHNTIYKSTRRVNGFKSNCGIHHDRMSQESTDDLPYGNLIQ